MDPIWDGTQVLQQFNPGSQLLWSNKTKQDFIDTLKARVSDAQFIITGVINKVWEEATKRYFVSHKDISYPGDNRYYSGPRGSLTNEELARIVNDRASTIIESLPSSIAITRIIRPDTAKKMDLLAELNKKIAAKNAELDELPMTVDIRDHMEKTVKEFLAFIDKNRNLRARTVELLLEYQRDAADLQKQINRELYKGIPALQEAVKQTVDGLIEQKFAYGNLFRRLEEKIKFGDSEESLAILRKFHENEVQLGEQATEFIKKATDSILIKAKPSKKLANKSKK